MFFKNPLMFERSEFSKGFKKHTNVAGGSTKIYRCSGTIMVLFLKSFKTHCVQTLKDFKNKTIIMLPDG